MKKQKNEVYKLLSRYLNHMWIFHHHILRIYVNLHYQFIWSSNILSSLSHEHVIAHIWRREINVIYNFDLAFICSIHIDYLVSISMHLFLHYCYTEACQRLYEYIISTATIWRFVSIWTYYTKSKRCSTNELHQHRP